MNRKQLIEELLSKNIIRIGESINYTRFKQIHSNGYSHISEYDFAEILGINNGNFNNVKNKGKNAIILKDLIPMQQERLEREISEDLLNRLEAGQKIDYQQFCTLRQKYCNIYGDIPETLFGRFLELNDDDLYRLRNGKEVSIFKSRFNMKAVTNALIAEGIVVPGDKINYSEFLKIYEVATKKHPSIGHFSQYAFAKLLGIRKSTFTKFKNGTIRLQILKDYMPKTKKTYVVSDEERMNIVRHLINTRGAKPYEPCNYERFRELYEGYEHISEYNFAHILDMSSSSFSSIKNRGKQARILKDCLDKEQVLAEILANGKLQIGEEINYAKFRELYKDYEYLEVCLFADIIEVSEGNLERLRSNPCSTTVALKSKKEKQEKTYSDNRERARTYIGELFEKGSIHIGQEIDYQKFQELYSLCNYIPEYEFAALLGISYFNYQNIKYMHSKTHIQDYRVIEAVRLIGNIERQRFYSKAEIDSICQKYQITQEDFIRYFVYKGNLTTDIQLYTNALITHNGLYIGRTRMSNEYFERMRDIIVLPISRLVGSMCKKYGQLRNIEDYKSEAILYVLENCGDIEKNLYDCEDSEIIVRIFISRVRFFLLDKMVNNLKLDTNAKSTNSFYTRRDKKQYDVPDKKTDVEAYVMHSIIDETLEAKIMRRVNTKF